MGEFYYQSTRSTKANRLTHREAIRFIETLWRMQVQPVTEEVFRRATELSDRFGISYWDAAILSAAKAMGCEEVYSEDMSHQQDYDGTRVINPFSDKQHG